MYRLMRSRSPNASSDQTTGPAIPTTGLRRVLGSVHALPRHPLCRVVPSRARRGGTECPRACNRQVAYGGAQPLLLSRSPYEPPCSTLRPHPLAVNVTQASNVQVHRARATAVGVTFDLSCAGSGATASWAA